MGIFSWFFDKGAPEYVKSEKIDRSMDFSNFEKITSYIHQNTGISDLERRALSKTKIIQFAESQGIYTTDLLLREIEHNETFYQEILNIVTVNETFFLREIRELQWLIEEIKKSKDRLKILSIPCSSGEEIYSILLLMRLENIELDRVEITGYDISTKAIENAYKGIYSKRSIQNVPQEERDRYFTKISNGCYQITQELREIPHFLRQNIFDLATSDQLFDVILSRNLFIYFDQATRKRALSIIIKLLKPGGIYIKGHADQIGENDRLRYIRQGIYKKI